MIITRAEVYPYLDQLTQSEANNALLDSIILRVESILELLLGFEFDPYPATPSTKVVYGSGTPWLSLPPHEVGSVTLVHAESDTSLTDIEGYAEEADGSALYFTGYNPYGGRGWHPQRYVVTAKWGVGPAPASLKEVAIELVVNLWKDKDNGQFTDVIGVTGEGGITTGDQKALTARQKMVVTALKRKYTPLMVA